MVGRRVQGKKPPELINDWIPSAIPTDVCATRVVTGGDRFASRRAGWGYVGAVRYDVAVFVVKCMAVAESYEGALTMPGGEACGVAMRSGEEKLIGIAQGIKW